VGLDPAVAAALGDGERRSRRRGMTAGERRSAKRQEGRSKMTLDLPAALIEELRRLAGAEECSESSLAAALLARGLEAYARGEVGLRKRLSRSPRFRWVVEVGSKE